MKVTAVEIKDVESPVTMQRAMAKQAEAEREKRAKVIQMMRRQASVPVHEPLNESRLNEPAAMAR